MSLLIPLDKNPRNVRELILLTQGQRDEDLQKIIKKTSLFSTGLKSEKKAVLFSSLLLAIFNYYYPLREFAKKLAYG